MSDHYHEQREKKLGTNNHKDVISSDLDADMKNSWGTEPVIFEALNKEFNFALDAAASDKNHKVPNYLTKEDDSLFTDWSENIKMYGSTDYNSAWLNPPLSKDNPGWKKCGGKSTKTKNIRSATPRGFAQAVFEANHHG